MYYLITFHESDGNDCTVFDCVIEAPSAAKALDALNDSVAAELQKDGRPFEEDGMEFGFDFGCADDCPDDCDGHGGIALRECEEYPTEAQALAQCSKFHLRWEA